MQSIRIFLKALVFLALALAFPALSSAQSPNAMQQEQRQNAIMTAVKALQEDNGLSQTGVVNEATWDALFDIDDPGDLDLRQSFIAPLAEATEVKKWLRTGNGFAYAPNPDYDPDRIEVGVDWDFGVMAKAKARRIAKRHRQRIAANAGTGDRERLQDRTQLSHACRRAGRSGQSEAESAVRRGAEGNRAAAAIWPGHRGRSAAGRL